jgi:hypothetical protein
MPREDNKQAIDDYLLTIAEKDKRPLISTEEGGRTPNAGDWIVTYPNGERKIFSDEEFNDKFEKFQELS